ncbi:MAG TPA: lysozyme [Actinospica sp.]|jgi:GH25 family lysozyme M1 (1,4-beta-N-acetylmuramidase)|nr:lysozyme [Actinospica sp.]
MAPSAGFVVPRRTLALTSVLVTAAVVASLATANPDSPNSDTGRASAAVVGASWAHDLSGKVVSVTPTNFTTPIHPELVTHPESDDMGSSMHALELAASNTPASGPGSGSAPATAAVVPDLASKVQGIDVSSHQPSIDWSKVAPHVNFVYAKATEGTYYVNPLFDSEYEGPYNYGVIRGSYHFAVPSNSSGTAQADYFIAHGGGWSADGKTLPGALDIEYNPYGKACYGLSAGQMVNWIKNFVTEYAAREHAFPVIYSTTDWWRTCTGNSAAFANDDPVWIANYGRSGGTLPNGWNYYSFWQYSDSGPQPGDQDVFNGGYPQLRTLAVNG